MYSGSWSVGDVIRYSVEFQFDNDWNGNARAELKLGTTGMSVNVNSPSAYPYEGKQGTTGILTGYATVPTGAPNVQLYVLMGAPGLTGTMRIGRVGVQNLTQLGLTSYSGI